MQTVGAQWLVVNDSHAAILVSLVQTAYTLPAVLFALVEGVLADTFDRVKLLVAVLAGMTAAGAVLTALTAAHRMPPALLLMFTFVLGTSAILVLPAYQSLVPDMVPRPQLPAATGLSSISINLARAIGPAIAGRRDASRRVLAKVPHPLPRQPDVGHPENILAVVKTLLHSVYDRPDAASVHAQYDRLVDTVTTKLPAVAARLDAARPGSGE
jgi:hypothetical protein